MDFAEYFPVWNKLTPQQQSKLKAAVFMKNKPAGMYSMKELVQSETGI